MAREEEKRTETLPALRVTAQTLDSLKELAFMADRSFSDYLRWVLEMHLYGHARSLPGQSEPAQLHNASQCNARKIPVGTHTPNGGD